MSRSELDPKDEQMISRLIHSSGRGPTPPPGARERVYQAVYAEWQRNVAVTEEPAPPVPRRTSFDWLYSFMRPALALAAAVAIAVGAFSFLQTPASIERVELASVGKVLGSVSVESTDGDSVPAAAGMTLVAGEHLMTGQDGGVALMLATGESVRLNAGTEILLAATGSLELRSGAIYLDSERVADGSSGVIVATRFGDVQHIGTQYQVNVDSRDLIVRIREGAVAIDLGAQDLVGRAGEQIVVPRAGDIVRTGISPTDAAWLWAESLATLPEAAEYALVELLSWYARQTGRELRFQSQAIEREAGELVLHGIGGLNPDEVLEVIRSTTSLGYQLSSDSLMVD